MLYVDSIATICFSVIPFRYALACVARVGNLLFARKSWARGCRLHGPWKPRYKFVVAKLALPNNYMLTFIAQEHG